MSMRESRLHNVLLVEHFGAPPDGSAWQWLPLVPHSGGVPLAGHHADFHEAARRAALALLVAYMLGCRVEAFAFGRTGCDSGWHWLVTVTPHAGRCADLACLRDYGNDCHLVEAQHLDLHGGHSAWKTLPWLVTGWAARHADWMEQIMERLGAPDARTIENVTAGLTAPAPYSFRDYWTDIQAIDAAIDS